MSVSFVARRAGISPSQLFAWKRRMLEGGHVAVEADEEVVGASQVRDLERKVRELERLLGRKTMENEILKEALSLARPDVLTDADAILAMLPDWIEDYCEVHPHSGLKFRSPREFIRLSA